MQQIVHGSPQVPHLVFGFDLLQRFCVTLANPVNSRLQTTNRPRNTTHDQGCQANANQQHQQFRDQHLNQRITRASTTRLQGGNQKVGLCGGLLNGLARHCHLLEIVVNADVRHFHSQNLFAHRLQRSSGCSSNLSDLLGGGRCKYGRGSNGFTDIVVIALSGSLNVSDCKANICPVICPVSIAQGSLKIEPRTLLGSIRLLNFDLLQARDHWTAQLTDGFGQLWQINQSGARDVVGTGIRVQVNRRPCRDVFHQAQHGLDERNVICRHAPLVNLSVSDVRS